ncbi:hypothetical protein B0H16DRAFT_1746967 [Mycena metata]|uniref:Uncharacterized protein n=1 Tax=Mycena metata TaxID=1033252 RepID=A0AAD7GUX9_9AGAR|nr:hypothetical protein B0H16DRAFT_1746967 [Mycena metata]
MPGGRPRLDPEAKQEHLVAARTRYENKNVEQRREKAPTIAASDYHTQRKYRDQAAAASERYRDRKAADERAEFARKLKSKKQARKKEAESLRQAALKLAAEMLKTKPQEISSSKKSSKKTSRPSSATAVCAAATSKAAQRAVPASKTTQRAATDDFSSDDDGVDIQRPHEDNRPLLARRTFISRKCRECDLDDCPGCACMCMVSLDWIEHEGGHFYPPCKACRVEDCPGCACVCAKSTVWKEHGGHVRMKMPLFTSP